MMQAWVHGAVVFLLAVSFCSSQSPPARREAQALPCPEQKTLIRIESEAARGKTFTKKISAQLEFSLLPREQGWYVSLHPPGRPAENYASVATPPFRGINDLDIQGWHFRNAENTGANTGGLNAPQELREFSFVATPQDYERASNALDKMLWSYGYSEEQIEEARRIHREAVAAGGTGRLRIVDMKLGNLVQGKPAWFEKLQFEVELCLSGAANP